MGQRKQYDKEFKLEVVKLVKSGKSASSVANELGIGKSTVIKWVNESDKHRDKAFPGQGHLRPEDEEIRKLKRQIADLQEENAILKKATAIFIKHQK